MEETVGKASLKLMQEPQENKDVNAQREAMLSDFEKNFYQAFDRGKAQFNGDFYIAVITKKERLMQNVLRNYFLVRESCPTPDYDQAVYHCRKRDNAVELLWTIPNIQACERYKVDPLGVKAENRELLKCIFSFYDGSLLRHCKKLNGELKESTVSSSFDPNDFKDHENLVIQS